MNIETLPAVQIVWAQRYIVYDYTHSSIATYVTGFAKTVPNDTLIKLQYKPLKKHTKLFYFTSCL